MRRLSLLFLLLMSASTLLKAETKPLRVAIIFDDGPIQGPTETLLAVLQKEKVHITFGTVATKAEAHPEGTRAAAKAGHEIANHSLTHEHPKPLSDTALEEQIIGAQKVFAEKIGVKPVWYWPPFIEIDPRMPALTQRAGVTIYPYKKIVACMDFVPTVTAEDIRKNATTGIEDGTVILFHEWRKESTDQLPDILAELRRQGCVFMTFSELSAALAK